MNRVLVALAFGLACSGCAADVEDAQPPPVEQEPQRNPPRPFIGPWENPYEAMLPNVKEIQIRLDVPQLVAPPFPDPDPNLQR